MLKTAFLFFMMQFVAIGSLWADKAQVAVAANFSGPMKELAERFQKATGHELVISVGSTGALYAQIANGAPFDVFFSADQAAPARLVAEDLAVADSLFTYAQGTLALYQAQTEAKELGPDSLWGDYQHLAIANPQLAPYGKAAQEVLTALKLWDSLESKIVMGENISQTFQFIETKNAQLGFIALSQIIKDGKITEGAVWLVPQDLYSPIKQDFVILKKAAGNQAAQDLAKFLKGPATAKILQNYGYTLAVEIVRKN